MQEEEGREGGREGGRRENERDRSALYSKILIVVRTSRRPEQMDGIEMSPKS